MFFSFCCCIVSKKKVISFYTGHKAHVKHMHIIDVMAALSIYTHGIVLDRERERSLKTGVRVILKTEVCV